MLFSISFPCTRSEYSRNLWFQTGGQMEQVFQAFIDRSRVPLNLDHVKTIFGDRYRPHRRRREKDRSRWGVVGVRRSLTEFPNVIRRLQEILERFLDSLYCLKSSLIADTTLEDLPSPAQAGKVRVGGIDLNKPRMRLVLESVLSLSTSPRGFTASDLTLRTKELGGPTHYTPRQAAYDIRKLPGKQLVEKLAKSRRYQPTESGLRAIAALVVLRDK